MLAAALREAAARRSRGRLERQRPRRARRARRRRRDAATLARLGATVRVLALVLAGRSALPCGRRGALARRPTGAATVVELGVGAAVGGRRCSSSPTRRRALGRARPGRRRRTTAPRPARSGTRSSATCAPPAWILAGVGRGRRRRGGLADPAGRARRAAARALGAAGDRRAATPRAARAARARARSRPGVVVAHRARRGRCAAGHARAGVYLDLRGRRARCCGSIYRPPRRGAERPRRAAPAPAAAAPARRRGARRRSLIAGARRRFVGTGGDDDRRRRRRRAATATRSCATARSTEVALAATHNSMSVPLPGWFSSEQDAADRRPARRRHPRPADRHPLRRPAAQRPAAHRTSAARGRAPQAAQDGVSPSAVDAALRLRERLGFAGEGERGMYLCHTFCELGATPLAVGARRHPRLPRRPPRRGRRRHQPGLRHAGGLRRRGDDAGPRRPRLPRPDRRRLADAARDDRPRPARRVPRREPTPARRPGTSPPTSDSPRRRRTRSRRPPQLTDPADAARELPPEPRARRARRCSSSTTGSRPTRCRARRNAAEVNAYGPLLRARAECRRIRDHLAEPRRGRTSTAAATLFRVGRHAQRRRRKLIARRPSGAARATKLET